MLIQRKLLPHMWSVNSRFTSHIFYSFLFRLLRLCRTLFIVFLVFHHLLTWLISLVLSQYKTSMPTKITGNQIKKTLSSTKCFSWLRNVLFFFSFSFLSFTCGCTALSQIKWNEHEWKPNQRYKNRLKFNSLIRFVQI